MGFEIIECLQNLKKNSILETRFDGFLLKLIDLFRYFEEYIMYNNIINKQDYAYENFVLAIHSIFGI